jgi:hypothetical protein
MKNNKYLKLGLMIFLAFSIMTVLIVASQRIKVEKKNNQVEMIVEYGEIKKLASQSDYSMQEWLVNFKKSGMNSVTIMEETLLQYMSEKSINYKVVSLLINDGDWEKMYPIGVVNRLKDVDPNSLLIELSSEEDYNLIVSGLSYYSKISFWDMQINDKFYIIVDQTLEDLIYAKSNDLVDVSGRKIGAIKSIFGTEVLNVPIGFDKEKIDIIEKSGLKLMLRPLNYLNDPISSWKLYLGQVKKYGLGNKLLLFSGQSVVGFGLYNDDYIKDIDKFVSDNNINIGLVETIEQRQYFILKGLEPVVNNISKDKFVRIFNIWDFISKRYKYYAFYEGGEEIGNSMYRAITERNVRAIYFRPFINENGSYVTNLDDYTKMFKDLELRLAKHGYSYGTASTLEEFSLPLVIKIIITLQILVFGLILLNYIFGGIKFKSNFILLILGCISICLAYYVMPSLSVSLTALGSAVIFSTLSVTYFIKNCLLDIKRVNLVASIRGVIISCIISLVGALYIGSIMADTNYFLEIQLFKGVKLSLLAPILATGLIVIFFYIKEIVNEKQGVFIKELIEIARDFLNTSIKIKYAVVLGVVGILGYIYLARSGNESNLQPMTIELMFRNYLEDTLLARPRTKEFLIAFPTMMVGAYYATTNILNKDKILKYCYILAFSLATIIGQTSITNTFSHIRTPLYISLSRTGYSVTFGVLIGIVAILVLKILIAIFNKIKIHLIRKIGMR